ncbi:hypothetical protein CEQ90_05295 [Lewinellaceae bacterium SD302]|nr:hypothetical protein CEQ90_05295 [Lewinellaceae bacterium SD302]
MQASEGGRLIAAAIEAHGGLEKWYTQTPLHFRFNYQPDEGAARDTRIMNDYLNSRAVHTMVSQPDVSYGWDGEKAWMSDTSANPGTSVRFWSLTPYYFEGLPFVLADEGINYEKLEPVEWQGTTYDLVKITYGEGVGDAPDDYYVIYVNPETKLVDALRYIVSYRGFFDDGKHLPEKLMTITEKTEVEGITLAKTYETRWWKGGEPSEVNTRVDVSEIAFRPDTDMSIFDMPSSAGVMNDLPK